MQIIIDYNSVPKKSKMVKKCHLCGKRFRMIFYYHNLEHSWKKSDVYLKAQSKQPALVKIIPRKYFLR